MAEPILIWGHGCFFGNISFEKRAFCLLAPPKQMLLLNISNENTKGARLGAIVAIDKGLE